MFPFQQIPNPYLNLNLDLSSSQSIPFASYMSKPEISNRMPQMFHPDAQAYANMPSLLTKRSPPIELNAPPTKLLHQDNFPYQAEHYRMQELNKSHGTSSKSAEEMNAQKLLMRSQQELLNLQKNQALAAQQFSGYGNGMSLQNIDLSQAEAQAYLGDTSSLAYIKQFLESKGVNNRDYGVQLQQQMNEPMQKYMANLYGLQNGLQANAGMQNLASLQNLGSLGNLGGLGSLANLGSLGGLGGLGNLNQLGSLANLGNVAGLGNLGNLNNLNNQVTMELLNQARSQQLNQQILQQLQPLNNMQSMPYLQELLKNDPSLRNVSVNDLMLLNSAVSQQQSFPHLLNQIPNVNLQTATMPQNNSPTSIASKSTAQTLVLQRPEPHRQEITLRKDNSSNQGRPQAHHGSMEVNEEGKIKPVVLVKPDNKAKKDGLEKTQRPQEMKETKIIRDERELAKPNEMRTKKIEIQNNVMIHQPVIQEPAWDNNGVLERRKNKPLQLQPEATEKPVVDMKKSITPGAQRSQQQYFGTSELEKQRQSQTPQAGKSKKIESFNGLNGKSDKMVIEREERKTNIRFTQNESLNRKQGNMEIEKNRSFEAERQLPAGSLMSSLNRGQSLMGNLIDGQYSAMESNEGIMKKEQEGTGVQKIVLTKRGPEYQAVVPELTLNDDEDMTVSRRITKLVWNPYEVNQKDIANYQKNLQRILGIKVLNQEKALKLLAKKEMDYDQALDTAKKNERHYSNFLGISNCTRELRSRRNLD